MSKKINNPLPNNRREETFNAIKKFVKELDSVFGDSYRPLQRYSRILSHIPPTNKLAIDKNVVLFQKFCEKNRQGIECEDLEQFEWKRLIYSKNAEIDFEHVFKQSDKETTELIWFHLLYICYKLDPTDKVRDLLKKKKTDSESKENAEESEEYKLPLDPDDPNFNFMNSIMNKVKTKGLDTMDQDENPMNAIGKIFQSGIINDIMSDFGKGIENGQLNMGSLMGSMNNMFAQTSNGGAGGVGGIGGAGGNGMPDLSGLMGLLGPMMANMSNMSNMSNMNIPNQTLPRIEEERDEKEDENK